MGSCQPLQGTPDTGNRTGHGVPVGVPTARVKRTSKPSMKRPATPTRTNSPMPVKCPAGSPCLMGLLVLTPVLVWAYWSGLGEVAEHWATDPQYSHGYLV